MKYKNQNDDDDNEDSEKQKICENLEENEQLYEETLFKNVDNDKCYYDDFNGGKIDESDTEEIKILLKEEYLLKNNDDNDEKFCIELDSENMKKGAVCGNNEKTTEQLYEENLLNVINKRLIKIVINKMKNKENAIALYK